jgi:hypothetical protein
MRNFFLVIIATFIVLNLNAQTGNKISPVKMVNLLGKGMLLEPQAGAVDLAISAPYKPEYGQILKDLAYQSVRIRYQGNRNPMQKAIYDGKPYDADDQALIDELKTIIDDLLSKDLAVIVTFFGVDGIDDGDGTTDLQKMTDWWEFVADNLKDYDHRVLFNLFVEPYALWKNTGESGVARYYQDLTDVIRQTNPTRTIVYFAIPPTPDNAPYGPGVDNFMTSSNLLPTSAGIYHMWDFHVLKNDTRDNIRLIEQAWEWREANKESVWSGAWWAAADDFDRWVGDPMAEQSTLRFIDKGIPSAYLMMFDGHTGIYDAQNDRNGNGILDEWTYPGLEKVMVSGPGIWWNLLSNPGFEQSSDNWQFSDATCSIKQTNGDSYLQVPESTTSKITITQDVTLALKNNGAGTYNVMAYIKSVGSTNIKFILSINTGSGTNYESSIKTVSGEATLLNESLSANWTGDIQSAEFIIELDGDACTIDKTGLTQFYYPDTELNITLWPGERINIDNYTTNLNSVIDINRKIRNITLDLQNAGDTDILPYSDAVDAVTDRINDSLELHVANYTRVDYPVEYRIGGYYQGGNNSNPVVKADIFNYIEKDPYGVALNIELIDAQDDLRDYLVLNDYDFRVLFYDVFRGYPLSIKDNVYAKIDTTVTENTNSLTANQSGAAYQWCDCENLYNPLSGGTGQTFTPVFPGVYAVKITNTDGYTVYSGCHEIKDVATGIKDGQKISSLKVYPNPVKDFINIETKNGDLLNEVEIWDMQGKIIRKYSNLKLNKTSISLNIPEGVYLLKVVAQKNTELLKIIKQ